MVWEVLVSNKTIIVAPLVGAWIEIIIAIAMPKIAKVAPLVGAWIEIQI